MKQFNFHQNYILKQNPQNYFSYESFQKMKKYYRTTEYYDRSLWGYYNWNPWNSDWWNDPDFEGYFSCMFCGKSSIEEICPFCTGKKKKQILCFDTTN